MNFNPNLTRQLSSLSALSPTMQRLSIGATGLVLQTSIDATNPNVDKSTQKYSAIRTAVKMVVTTLGGIFFRFLGQKTIGEPLVNKGILEVPKELIQKMAKLTPEVRIREFCDFKNLPLEKAPKVVSPEMLAKIKFAGAVGWVCAVGAAVVSVFVWDMPFVNKVMNFVLDKVYGKNKPENKGH